MTIWGATSTKLKTKLDKKIDKPIETHKKNGIHISIQKNHPESEIIEKKNTTIAVSGVLYRNKKPNLKKTIQETESPKKLIKMDGEFAFAWQTKNQITLGRDHIGTIPLYYTKTTDGIAFSTNKKTLLQTTNKKPHRITPGHIHTIRDNKITDKVIIKTRETKKEIDKNKKPEEYGKQLIKKLDQAIQKRINGETAIAFSGGIDSSLIAKLASKHTETTLYTVGYTDSPDIKWSKKAAKNLNLPHKPIEIDLNQIEKTIPKTIETTCDATRLTTGVGLPFYILAEQLKKDGYTTILTGQGSDELFGGYTKYRNTENPETEMYKDIEHIAKKDLERDHQIFTAHGIIPKNPFLDQKFVETALSIPLKHRTPNSNQIEKQILRTGAKKILPQDITQRPKKSLQYGSRIDREIDRIARRNGYKRREKHHVDKYLASIAKEIFEEKNLKHVTRSFNN
ncbi:Asparagine synthase (glutamine-hydrolyzing) [Methanonatronarchaeum thermophilum]|uniref:Asparagine synthase (Glutamine-hydrolyzing) n=1 Tax=Methanonatronarchaeum thermophilum TaxID=1927129 RepID=A0A1Y3GG27_9EURY|nr:asparagine synthase-related protein [Methanonatronarchaeum thermophilum]OUJ19164.1 Asparagine synthase (glutamine-hydrolyzing) [Methanonatronarchaeum thermophilum]